MSETSTPLTYFYKGWDVYQQRLISVLTPLSSEQLALQASKHHWTVEMLAKHIIATRAGWFNHWLKEGDATFASFAQWDEPPEQPRSAAELVAGLEATWRVIQSALERWTEADLEEIFERPGASDNTGQQRIRRHTRQWIIWHVIEHDMNHGGEISLILGMHGLSGLNI